MSITPEGKVKKAVKKVLDDCGAYYFFPVTGGFGRSGVPDIICCIDGKFVALECKAGKNTTTALQDREIDLIRKNKGLALVVNEDTVDTLPEFIQFIKERR